MLLLKGIDAIVRWRQRQRAEDTSDLGLTLKAGAELREELREQLVALRSSLERSEKERDKLEIELAVAREHLFRITNERDDYMAEARMLRKRALTDANRE